MAKTFDVGIESLVSNGATEAAARQSGGRQAGAGGVVPLPFRGAHGGRTPVAAAATSGKSFFLETFGCQMNDHDSEKVAGVLQGRGYHAVESPALADLVLYNTC